jgi:hypothetical protein
METDMGILSTETSIVVPPDEPAQTATESVHPPVTEPVHVRFDSRDATIHDAVVEKKKRNVLGISGLVFSIISLFLSLITNVQPNWNPWNRNIEQKALAGNIDAQMLIADINYHVGNIEKSVTFYTLASVSANYEKPNERLSAAIALNNLGYIFATSRQTEIGAQDSSKKNVNDAIDESVEEAQIDIKQSNRDYDYSKSYFLYSLKALYPFLIQKSNIDISQIVCNNYIDSYVHGLQSRNGYFDEHMIISDLRSIYPSTIKETEFNKNGYLDFAAFNSAVYNEFFDIYLPYSYGSEQIEILREEFEGYFFYNNFITLNAEFFFEEDSDEFAKYSESFETQVLDAYPELKYKSIKVIGNEQYSGMGKKGCDIYSYDFNDYYGEPEYINYVTYAHQRLNRFFDKSY